MPNPFSRFAQFLLSTALDDEREPAFVLRIYLGFDKSARRFYENSRELGNRLRDDAKRSGITLLSQNSCLPRRETRARQRLQRRRNDRFLCGTLGSVLAGTLLIVLAILLSANGLSTGPGGNTLMADETPSLPLGQFGPDLRDDLLALFRSPDAP